MTLHSFTTPIVPSATPSSTPSVPTPCRAQRMQGCITWQCCLSAHKKAQQLEGAPCTLELQVPHRGTEGLGKDPTGEKLLERYSGARFQFFPRGPQEATGRFYAGEGNHQISCNKILCRNIPEFNAVCYLKDYYNILTIISILLKR